jgi:hypothetical protein
MHEETAGLVANIYLVASGMTLKGQSSEIFIPLFDIYG